mgnify:FL=1
MYYYKDRHSKQSKYAVKRRKKVNSIAITISNFTVTVMAIWLMMIASIIGLTNTTLVPKDIIDPLKIGSKYRHTSVVATHVATTSFTATPINTITTTNPIEEEKMILPMSEEAELEYEAELAAELIASSEEAQQIEEIQQQPVVEETTTQPIEEATPVTENIEEENHSQWWTEEDYQYLLMIIVGEAQNCSRQEQMYVGSVVLNRLHSPWFPKQNTIKQVATAKGQYACMWDGNAYKTPTETNKEVALELLNNGSVLPENVVFQALFKQGNGVYCKINKTL